MSILERIKQIIKKNETSKNKIVIKEISKQLDKGIEAEKKKNIVKKMNVIL